MSSDRFQRVRAVFEQALGLPPERRAEFLADVCGDDANLLAEVERLLDADSNASEIDPSDSESTVAMDRDEPASLPPLKPGEKRIGPYRLIRQIGEGGMGVVWEAEQLVPVRRKVALKLIRNELQGSQVLARFESERQALALMSHPNVTKVLDAGTDEHGSPYFAMEFIRGDPINEYCDRHRLSTRERLELLIGVCEGVQHAHQKGIIHRDLKPTNVLVEIQDDRPVPRIIDFGVAKAIDRNLTERTLFTEYGQMIGTPEYMSPEQAEMTRVDIDTRTDVYSLGVMLYELLVGALPFDSKELRKAGYDEIRRRIREETPHKPSTRLSTLGDSSSDVAERRRSNPSALVRSCQGDLDWITMKAMEKDRTRRYGSASELAADLLHHLNNEPVLAGPPSAAYRLQKFVRRHRFGVATAVMLTLAVLLGLVGTTYNMIRAQRAEAVVRTALDTMERMITIKDPDRATKETATEALKDMIAVVQSSFADEPALKARLLYMAGGTARQLGLFEEATPLIEESVEEYVRAYGEWHPMTARSLSLLAGQLIRSHRPLEAIPHLERMKKIYDRIGAVDASVARMENNFGAAYRISEQYELAIPHFERAAEIYTRMNDPKRSKPIHNLAQIHSQMGNQDEAQKYMARVVETRQEILGKAHSDTLNAMNTLATMQRKRGELDLARETVTEAIELQRDHLGPKHADLAYSLATLGLIERDAGNIAQARVHLGEALEVARSTLGAENSYTRSLEGALQGLPQ